MWDRTVKLGLVVFLAGAGLAVGQFRVEPDHELDDYTDEELTEYLTAELDDIEVSEGGQLEADGEYALRVLEGAILRALGDGGDDDDEGNIDYADLEEEMSEAGTTLQTCIHNALLLADELSVRDGSPSRRPFHGRRSMAAPSVRFHNAGFSLIAQSRKQNGFATTSVAIARAVPAMVADVDRVRRRREG